MPTHLSRSAWTKRGPVRGLTALRSAEVKGVALHWPGTTGPIGDPGKSKIASRLEGYRRYHAGSPPAGRGWNDIAYNVAVDQAGRVWDLRGVGYMSAANGDQASNKTYVAILVLVGPGERLTDECIEGVKYARDMVLAKFPHATAVKGHQDVRPSPTACPGSIIESAIKAGVFSTPRVPAKPSRDVPRPAVITRILREGMTGREVEALQKALNKVNKKDIRVDGDFGPATKAAVKTAQRRVFKLQPWQWDGIVGPATAPRIGLVFRKG